MLLKNHECLTFVIKRFVYSTNVHIITIRNDLKQGYSNYSAVISRCVACVKTCRAVYV
jgi:hypothetical protein